MIKRYVRSAMLQAVTALVLMILIGAIWLFGVLDERELLLDRAGRLDDARLELAKARTQKQDLVDLLDQYGHNRQQIAYLREQFLRQKDQRVVDISAAIAELATRYRIALNEVRYASSQSRNQELEIYRVELPLEGRYRDLRNFVSEIESSDLQLTVQRIEVEESTSFQGSVRARLSLATYFERGEA